MNDAQKLIKLLMQALDCKRENYPPLLDCDILDMKIDAAKRAYLRFVDAGGLNVSQEITLLSNLVEALEKTNWSSWQSTSKFWQHKEAAEAFLQTTKAAGEDGG